MVVNGRWPILGFVSKLSFPARVAGVDGHTSVAPVGEPPENKRSVGSPTQAALVCPSTTATPIGVF